MQLQKTSSDEKVKSKTARTDCYCLKFFFIFFFFSLKKGEKNSTQNLFLLLLFAYTALQNFPLLLCLFSCFFCFWFLVGILIMTLLKKETIMFCLVADKFSCFPPVFFSVLALSAVVWFVCRRGHQRAQILISHETRGKREFLLNQTHQNTLVWSLYG